jgi:hypothetical protein
MKRDDRKPVRVNVEVVYDDGTLTEIAFDAPVAQVLSAAMYEIQCSSTLKHCGDGESWG